MKSIHFKMTRVLNLKWLKRWREKSHSTSYFFTQKITKKNVRTYKILILRPSIHFYNQITFFLSWQSCRWVTSSFKQYIKYKKKLWRVGTPTSSEFMIIMCLRSYNNVFELLSKHSKSNLNNEKFWYQVGIAHKAEGRAGLGYVRLVIIDKLM